MHAQVIAAMSTLGTIARPIVVIAFVLMESSLSQADVTSNSYQALVKVNESLGTCKVYRPDIDTELALPCDTVVGYVRDTLHLERGDICPVMFWSGSASTDLSWKLMNALAAAAYRTKPIFTSSISE